MNKTAIITLSEPGFRVAKQLAPAFPSAEIFLHESIPAPEGSATPFPAIIKLTAEIFHSFRELVYIAPCGVVVRAIAPLIQHKLSDPAVVALDVGGRWAVSLLSGHEGGANSLAITVANTLGAEPVISTTTEAVKRFIIGIGCRRGTSAETLIAAIREGASLANISLEEIRYLASAELKADETGLLEASAQLGIPLRFLAAEEILSTTKAFRHSDFVANKVKLPAVAEPSALLAGRRTSLILPKTIIRGTTIAIARENCLSLASAPAAPSTEPTAPKPPSAPATSS